MLLLDTLPAIWPLPSLLFLLLNKLSI